MKSDLRSDPCVIKRCRTIAVLAALTGAPLSVLATSVAAQRSSSRKEPLVSNGSSFHTTKDGTRIFFKDGGKGKPIVFSHGWPLDADAWDPQMLFLGLQGYRVIAHDRRAHGRSTQTLDGNDMNTYADDLSGLLDMLDVRDAMLVGHSSGGGEVIRYLGHHGTKRVSKGIKGQYDCVKQFSETDFTQDLQNIKIPTLILHGDDDQIVPISDSAALSSKLLSNATLKVYQ